MLTPSQERRARRQRAAARLKSQGEARKGPPVTPEAGGQGEAEVPLPNRKDLLLESRALKRRWPAQLETLKARCILETNNALMNPNATLRDKLRAISNVIRMDQVEMEQEKRNAEDPEQTGPQPVVNIRIIAPPAFEVERNGDNPHDP